MDSAVGREGVSMNVVDGVEIDYVECRQPNYFRLGVGGEMTSMSSCEADEEESVSPWIARLVHTLWLIQ